MTSRTPAMDLTYRYHPRSNSHSIALVKEVLHDLMLASPRLRDHAMSGKVAYGIELNFTSPVTNKSKNFDMCIGLPETPVLRSNSIQQVKNLREVRISVEAKACMTEHVKSKPRLFDELSSSHEIVHQGNPEAIACGITVANMADRFLSPLRQKVKGKLDWTKHRQPDVTQQVVQHLRGLVMRDSVSGVGFDAFCTFCVACDNQNAASNYTDPPCPQPGDADHYDTFISRIASFYEQRFS